eukprot:NODE_5176_length_526_cov_151.953878_g3828_i0.p3 GENE.NODE_5176_length_526_cov_151.953878_g3828_i0~~NODE_5176_length_526_cov_151.953878_g3828_i0.p3  ORF type:complete len:88 (-),score=20.16 NODE_5176_length_526_cov_151.953878_g3828_i0:261-500(-)
MGALPNQPHLGSHQCNLVPVFNATQHLCCKYYDANHPTQLCNAFLWQYIMTDLQTRGLMPRPGVAAATRTPSFRVGRCM